MRLKNTNQFALREEFTNRINRRSYLLRVMRIIVYISHFRGVHMDIKPPLYALEGSHRLAHRLIFYAAKMRYRHRRYRVLYIHPNRHA